MKQLILSVLLLLVSLSVAAQNAKNDSIHERFFNAKVRELTYRLNITDAQKPKFVTVYRHYNDEMRAVWFSNRPKNAPDPKNFGKPLSSSEVAAAQKRWLVIQQKAQNVQMKYLDEFAKVLDAKQMSRIYEEEQKIQKKLFERKNHPKGKQGVRLNKDGKKVQDKQFKKEGVSK